jgi:hypothetical protein
MPETRNTGEWQAELEVVVVGSDPASGRYVTAGPAR